MVPSFWIYCIAKHSQGIKVLCSMRWETFCHGRSKSWLSIDFSIEIFVGDEIVIKTFAQSFKESMDILVIETFLLRQISRKKHKNYVKLPPDKVLSDVKFTYIYDFELNIVKFIEFFKIRKFAIKRVRYFLTIQWADLFLVKQLWLQDIRNRLLRRG